MLSLGEQSASLDLYLTLAPRGLEQFVIENIRSQLERNRHTCWISEIGTSPLTQLHNVQNEMNGCSSTERGAHTPLDEIAAKIEYNKYKKMAKKRKKETEYDLQQANITQPAMLSFNDYTSQSPNLLRAIGSMNVPDIGSHVSLGYHTVDDKVQRILSVPGTLEGIVLVAFQTDAPPILVGSMLGMGCGPLLALISSSCLQMPNADKNDVDSTTPKLVDGKLFVYEHTLEEGSSVIQSFFAENKHNYFQRLQAALHLWSRHSREVWHSSDSIYGHYKDPGKGEENQPKSSQLLKMKEAKPFSYRLSCTRSHSKKYSHLREALVPCLGNWVIPMETIDNAQRKNEKQTIDLPSKWVVDLKDYDIEIVSMIHFGCLTVAIPLRPYQLWGSKSYRSNSLPVDGSGFFGRLGPKRSLGRFVHLRPSTADILINIADLASHSIVLDPCAGIGTINIRASLQSHYGLGGELVHSLFQVHAPYFLECNKKFQQLQRKGVVDMAGWDATMMPLRDSFVDAVISDIPFGQKCLTHNELHSFMSGFIYECARVLTRNSGKMVLLCGDCDIVVKALASLNERILRNRNNGSDGDVVFHLPCESIFPVNISGILAWIIVVRRGRAMPLPSTQYRGRTKPKNRISYAR